MKGAPDELDPHPNPSHPPAHFCSNCRPVDVNETFPDLPKNIQIHECSSEDPQLTPRILELLDAGLPVVLRSNTGWEHIILPGQHDPS
ncbi:MAG: hypothetical protein AAFO67_04115 [Planctomycetota bacterium]